VWWDHYSTGWGRSEFSFLPEMYRFLPRGKWRGIQQRKEQGTPKFHSSSDVLLQGTPVWLARLLFAGKLWQSREKGSIL
jgi:hypothetical protein